MIKADEKKAFDDMLAEIEDSDEDEKVIPVRAEPKPSVASQPSAKSTNSYQSKSYKMSKEDEEIENFGSQSSLAPAALLAEQIGITKRWLVRPCSYGEKTSMKCYVERERASFGFQATYRCYLENSNNDSQSGRFMMSAKKKVAKKTSYYLLSIDMNPSDDRGSESVLGKVRGNAVGSQYLMTDHGLAPEKTVSPSMLRKEYGVINFEFDSGGPSRIEAWIPSVSQSGMVTNWQPDSETTGMEAKIAANDFSQMFRLVNKVPKWDEAHGGHVLNFQGRVTESSVKNFQLRCADNEDPEEVVLQFGRISKHKFTMDLKYPLSPMQAFSICVACLDGKIADRKGYEYLMKMTGGSNGSSQSDQQNVEIDAEVPAGSSTTQARGNMTGSSSMTGMWRENLPSTQYLKDKFTRSFK